MLDAHRRETRLRDDFLAPVAIRGHPRWHLHPWHDLIDHSLMHTRVLGSECPHCSLERVLETVAYASEQRWISTVPVFNGVVRGHLLTRVFSRVCVN